MASHGEPVRARWHHTQGDPGTHPLRSHAHSVQDTLLLRLVVKLSKLFIVVNTLTPAPVVNSKLISSKPEGDARNMERVDLRKISSSPFDRGGARRSLFVCFHFLRDRENQVGNSLDELSSLASYRGGCTWHYC